MEFQTSFLKPSGNLEKMNTTGDFRKSKLHYLTALGKLFMTLMRL
jgi:hypothetical protein